MVYPGPVHKKSQRHGELGLVSLSKKIMEVFCFWFFPPLKTKNSATCCAWRREQRLLFFLNDSTGFWNWAQQVGRACIDFKRYLNVTQSLLLRRSRTKHVSSFLYFSTPKQDILRKRIPALASLYFDLLSGRRGLAMTEAGSWEGLTWSFLVTSRLWFILNLRDAFPSFSLCFNNCHYCLLNVSLCVLYCNTLFQDLNGFLYSGTFHK